MRNIPTTLLKYFKYKLGKLNIEKEFHEIYQTNHLPAFGLSIASIKKTIAL